MDLKNSELGKKSEYKTNYDKNLLFPIPRQIKRDELGLKPDISYFKGYDLWNAYEVSWLNLKGRPEVRIVKFIIDSDSTNIIESKSFKLYLNSFNNYHFDSEAMVLSVLKADISEAVQGKVEVIIYQLDEYDDLFKNSFKGECLDQIDCDISEYTTNPQLLCIDRNNQELVNETLYSHLLKSNCLVTEQPDWGSVMIQYRGDKICHEGLLKYLVSFRNHNEFHEQCVERIFTDIQNYCKPKDLLVYAKYTRRGGLDINPLRCSQHLSIETFLSRIRLSRQ